MDVHLKAFECLVALSSDYFRLFDKSKLKSNKRALCWEHSCPDARPDPSRPAPRYKEASGSRRPDGENTQADMGRRPDRRYAVMPLSAGINCATVALSFRCSGRFFAPSWRTHSLWPDQRDNSCDDGRVSGFVGVVLVVKATSGCFTARRGGIAITVAAAFTGEGGGN
jgi:hypothetical protein